MYGRFPREVLSELDSADIAELMAYDQIEPCGPQRDDLRAGIIASTIGNCHRTKRSKAFKPSDFMYFIDKPKPTANQMLQMFKVFTAGVR